MKKVLYTLMAVIILISCKAEEPGKYVPLSAKKREKLATSEPGTYFKPAAYAILKEVNKILEDPEFLSQIPSTLPGITLANVQI